ncbi:MAG: hypothetical protein ACTSQ8_17460 [Candidatus Helarchaeota archaeon]
MVRWLRYFQKALERSNNVLFLFAGAVARTIYFFNRPLFRKRRKETINLRLRLSMGKAKRLLKDFGFVSQGSGYPHTRDQMWLYFRFNNPPRYSQLHARLRNGKNGYTNISVHFEPDWTQPAHDPDSHHPNNEQYNIGAMYFKKLLMVIFDEAP